MKTYLDCLPCLLNQSLRAVRAITDDEVTHRQVINTLAARFPELSLGLKPPEIAQQGYRIIREITGNHDPFQKVKTEANETALKRYPYLKELITGSKDPLLAACKLAIAGNSIDHGPMMTNLNIRQLLQFPSELDLVVNDYAAFLDDLAAAKRILYIGDNAGEIVLDRILIEELRKTKETEINFVVRDQPVINDVTIADAIATGMDQVAGIVSSGSDAPGTILPQCSLELQRYYHSSDLIISKGQGNYESLEGETGNLFFFLKAKCELVAETLGVKVGDAVLKQQEKKLRYSGHSS
jgi:uncharacterized protein with ATP-grasp and redox domains